MFYAKHEFLQQQTKKVTSVFSQVFFVLASPQIEEGHQKLMGNSLNIYWNYFSEKHLCIG